MSLEAITPIDVRQYCSYLLTAKARMPVAVSCGLASLSAWCDWARGADAYPRSSARVYLRDEPSVIPVEDVRRLLA